MSCGGLYYQPSDHDLQREMDYQQKCRDFEQFTNIGIFVLLLLNKFKDYNFFAVSRGKFTHSVFGNKTRDLIEEQNQTEYKFYAAHSKRTIVNELGKAIRVTKYAKGHTLEEYFRIDTDRLTHIDRIWLKNLMKIKIISENEKETFSTETEFNLVFKNWQLQYIEMRNYTDGEKYKSNKIRFDDREISMHKLELYSVPTFLK